LRGLPQGAGETGERGPTGEEERELRAAFLRDYPPSGDVRGLRRSGAGASAGADEAAPAPRSAEAGPVSSGGAGAAELHRGGFTEEERRLFPGLTGAIQASARLLSRTRTAPPFSTPGLPQGSGGAQSGAATRKVSLRALNPHFAPRRAPCARNQFLRPKMPQGVPDSIVQAIKKRAGAPEAGAPLPAGDRSLRPPRATSGLRHCSGGPLPTRGDSMTQ
jgi:hypothetical protein